MSRGNDTGFAHFVQLEKRSRTGQSQQSAVFPGSAPAPGAVAGARVRQGGHNVPRTDVIRSLSKLAAGQLSFPFSTSARCRLHAPAGFTAHYGLSTALKVSGHTSPPPVTVPLISLPLSARFPSKTVLASSPNSMITVGGPKLKDVA